MRTDAMAQRLYESIPKGVRNLGENGVKDFMHGKHASHIKSVVNAPNKAKWPGNVTWESSSKNAARGSRNMTASEIADARSAARASAINVGLKSTLRSAARGAVIAAVIEAPISGLENFLHWRRGRRTGGQAVKDSAKSTGRAATIGAGVFGVAKVASIAGLSLGPFGAPLAITGAGLFIATTIRRIFKAAKHDIPLDECIIYFCKGLSCKTRFAYGLTRVALQTTS